MKVQLKLFAVARLLAGSDTIELQVPDAPTVADVRDRLVEQVPDLSPLAAHLRISVNADYVSEDRLIQAEDELACIPPVSGG